MAADEVENDEAGSEVSLVVQDDDLLVAGEPTAVERYVAQLREVGRSLGTPELTARKLTGAASTGAALAALHATSGTVVQLSREHQEMFTAGRQLMRSSGNLKGAFVGSDGRITNLANLEEVSLVAEQALAVQGLMATVALRAAIHEVQEAVERVEGKVDELVALTRAHTIAGVVGKLRLLSEYVDRMDRTGVLPDVDWDTVAGLGPELAEGSEELRRFALERVTMLTHTQGARKRAEQLHQMADESRLGEVLQLLVVAEGSHYLWQCLRIERSRTSDPEQVGEIIESARRLLRQDLDADLDLALRLQNWLVEYGRVKPLEIHRVLSRNKLETDVPRLRQELDDFAKTRQLQVASWPDFERPTLKDAQAEVRRRAIGVREGVRELELPQKARDGVRGLSELTSERSHRALRAVRRRSRQSGD